MLNNVEDAADVKAADRVQAELAAMSDVVTSQSELKKLPPSRHHVHMTSPNNGLSRVSDWTLSLSITTGIIKIFTARQHSLLCRALY